MRRVQSRVTISTQIVTDIDMSFTPIGEALASKKNDNSALKKQADAGNVMSAAEDVFAELFGDLASHARPQFLKNRTLTVSCTSSAMAQEIRINQNKIVDMMNDALGEKLVDRIRYLA